jgi:hypothetical protein
MEIQYRSVSGRLFIKVEGASQKEAFKNLASAQEVFDGDDACGCCGNQHIRFRVRTVTKGSKSFDYFEMYCPQCSARLAFGQSQDTISLFPKRKDDNNNWLPARGWFKYQPTKEDE